ncbi:MAG: hypothetical protein EPN97_16745 [Alphaproteobacteria bacterium]|nr:MAG: hypothetical protein EPN97_16745 [Alphaproteobacteria bacterium]
MKDQSPLTPGEFREAFDKARTDARDSFAKSGTDIVLQYLSETIGSLQSEGIDVSLAIRYGTHTNAYDMMYTVSGNGGGLIEAYGFIECGRTTHMFAVATKHADKDVLRVYVSEYNFTGEGGRRSADGGNSYRRHVISGECFDFNEDAEALQKLQKKIVGICAGNQVMLECDTAEVFNKEPAAVNKMQKPGGKLKL